MLVCRLHLGKKEYLEERFVEEGRVLCKEYHPYFVKTQGTTRT